jgi:purine-binding chemotaxis protein CheW
MNETGNAAEWRASSPLSCQLHRSLVVRAANHTCALNLEHVIEILRPLPVALAALFNAPGGASTRFVIVRTGEKRIALAVDAVLGIREFAENDYQALPPLFRDAAARAVETIGVLDSELFFVLKTATLVPAELWESLTEQER